MSKIGIYPSIMCAKPWDLKKFVEEFEKNGVTSIHFDVMDGHYVPNIMLGSAYFKDLISITKLPVDIHLMVEEPEIYLDYFNLREGDYCCFHPETTRHPYKVLQNIRAKGCKAGLAISPGTSLDYIKECMGQIDYILAMSINPGFAAQKMLPDALAKLKRISDLCLTADHKIEIIVDGNTNVENAKKMIANGATGLVTGTSSMMKEGPEQFTECYQNYVSAINS